MCLFDTVAKLQSKQSSRGNNRGARMAKKGQATQLQLEVQNDDDWERLLDKDGLIGM